MQLISKGYFWFSSVLVMAGALLAWLVWPYIDGFMYAVKEHEYGRYIFILGIGGLLAALNVLECKTVWGRLLKNPKIDLLGVSAGLMIGLIIGYV